MFSGLAPMVRKEFIQMRRDRFMLALMVGIPSIQLVLFGYAIRTEVRHIPTVVLDESRTASSRRLLSVLEQTQNFSLTGVATSYADIARQIEHGKAHAAIVIPPDFQRSLKRGETAEAQVIVDAADPTSSASAISGASLASQILASELLAARSPEMRAMFRRPVLDVRVRPWYNPALESSTYIVPGIVGLLLTLTLMLVTSLAIVREREVGTLEQLVVTPIDRPSLMLGKVLPFVVVGYVQVTIVLLLGRLLFDMPVRGSLPLLYLLSAPFVMANLALGLLVSTMVRTQAQGLQLSLLFMLPQILLSGFMFPREAMPPAAQWIGLLLPLTYFLRVLRGILLRGVGITALWRDVGAIMLFATVVMTLSVRRFAKSIE